MSRVRMQEKDKPKRAALLGRDQSEGETLRITLEGDIDHHRAVLLREWMDELICDRRPQKLLLDMSGIEFMDSSGLGLVMGRYSLLGKLGGELIIVKPSATARRMLSLAAMERLVRIED